MEKAVRGVNVGARLRQMGGKQVGVFPVGCKSRMWSTRAASRQDGIVCWQNSKQDAGQAASDDVSSTFDKDMVANIISFPGEDAPGTGLRHLPNQQDAILNGHTKEKHAMRTTHECYELFPVWAHASCPLDVYDPEPTGMSAQRLPDAGPKSGLRRRPSLVESERPPLDPVVPKTVAARLRELDIRRHC